GDGRTCKGRGAAKAPARPLARRAPIATMSATPAPLPAAAAVPEAKFDFVTLLLVLALAVAALPFIRPSPWVTWTVAGLAMGMIIFIIASGLTLVFGLMDVLNFGHGVFIALGAFVATSVLGSMGDY